MLWTLGVSLIVSEFAQGGYALRMLQDPILTKNLQELSEQKISDVIEQMLMQPGVVPLELLMRVMSEKQYYSLHIPKAAGISFSGAANKLLGPQAASSEGCYSWSENLKINKTLLMLRRPVDHVLSMYYHCVSSKSVPNFFKKKMPKTFGEWVHNWTDIQQRGGAVGDFSPNNGDMAFVPTMRTSVPFKCYNPVNMQVQRMTCQKPYNYPLHADENLAIRNMQSAAFVGIVEAFHESACLLAAKMIGKLPIGCNCENQDEWAKFSMPKIDHGVQHHSITNYPEEVTNAVNKLVEGDRQLYQASVARFFKDMDDVEREHGVKVLCESTKQALIRT